MRKVWIESGKLWRRAGIAGNLRQFERPVDNSAENQPSLLMKVARGLPRDHSRARPRRLASATLPAALALLPALALLAALASACDRREQKQPAPPPPAAGAQPIRRVVTTTPSSTEIVAVAGGAGRIVGVDRFSDFPPEVVGLPVVGDFMSPSIEAILQLRPDLVVLDAVQSKTAEALAQGGVRTLVLEMHTVEDVLDGITSAGRALGSEAVAAGARAAIEREVAAVRGRGRSHARRPRALLVVDRELGALRGIVAAGPGSYLDQMLAIAGGENVLSGAGTRYPNIAPETIIEARPDVVLDAVHTEDAAAAVRDWKVLGRVPAVSSGRVHILAETYYKSPGPRLVLALRGLESLIHRDAR
jgi:iron complex transport system substrate-binding protein